MGARGAKPYRNGVVDDPTGRMQPWLSDARVALLPRASNFDSALSAGKGVPLSGLLGWRGAAWCVKAESPGADKQLASINPLAD